MGTTPKRSASAKGKPFFSLSSTAPTNRASASASGDGDDDSTHSEQLHSPGDVDASPGANTASAAPVSPAGEADLTSPKRSKEDGKSDDVQADAGVASGAAAVPGDEKIDDAVSPPVDRRPSGDTATGARAPPSPGD